MGLDGYESYPGVGAVREREERGETPITEIWAVSSQGSFLYVMAQPQPSHESPESGSTLEIHLLSSYQYTVRGFIIKS